jgi:formylglycine-generating enzyme required for sulfatase activity
MWQGLADGRLSVRLPTEAEWEKAARWTPPLPEGEGPGVRVYPWGDADWNEELANIDESGLGHPTPVGMYPQGAAPNNLFDLSGNLFEWTISLDYEKYPYPYDPTDGRENLDAPNDVSRVLRGGSWIFTSGDARCACRDRVNPDDFDHDLGFRMVLSLADSGS